MHHHRGGFGERDGFGRHGEERGEHRGRGGMRGGRVFDHGDLRWVVLALIAEKPSHGYEIIKAVVDRVGGAYSPSPGVIYPTLTLLEETGLVAVPGGRRRPQALRHHSRGRGPARRQPGERGRPVRADAARARAQRGGVAPPVMRALENLRTAVRLKLEQGPLTEEQARSLAEALDAAAVAVERA